MQIDLILGVVSFTGVVLLLVLVIIFARSRLVSTGSVNIEINDDPANTITVPAGSKLLQTLAENKIFLSSACGGGGTCSQCKCLVMDGGGSILPTEESHFTSKEQNEGWRLSCQVAVKNDLKIKIPDEVFGVKEWECEVISNDNVATFIKELILNYLKVRKSILKLAVTFNLKHQHTKISHTKLLMWIMNITLIGTSLKSGIMLQTMMSLLLEPIQWQIIQKKRVS